MNVLAKVKTKASGLSSRAKKKAVALTVSAVAAMNALAINAFAEGSGGGTGVNYSDMVSTLTSSFSEIVTQCVNVATAILPLGLGLIGLSKMFSVAKKFFTKSTSG